jgi:hypothetical protein
VKSAQDPAKSLVSSPLTAKPPLSDERRRVLRGALTAGPVIMTLASKPVLGQVVCATASATSAGSQAAKATAVCSGLTPSAWKARAMQWPLPYCATTMKDVGGLDYVGGHSATQFHCPTTGLGGRMFGDRTMLEVIDVGEGGDGVQSLGRYIVAALLNARAGRTPVLTETGARNMWNDLVNQGYYEPTAGIRWTAPEIIAYVKTTMT